MSASPYLTSDENARRTLRAVDGPLVFDSGAELVDTDFVVSPQFVPTSVCSTIYLPGNGYKIRNCTVRTGFWGYDPAWLDDPILKNWCGVRAAHCRGLLVDGLHVEGFPGIGFAAVDLVMSRLWRMSGTACSMIFKLGMENPGGNRNVEIDQLAAWDAWWPAPPTADDVNATPSRMRPGGWCGGDGFAGIGLRDCTLSRFEMSGELFAGVKLVRSQRVTLADVKTNHLMIQGTEGRYANLDGLTDGSEAITVRDLLVDKQRGWGAISRLGNGVQVSWNVRGLDARRHAILGGGTDGHGIQVVGDCEASFREGVVSGFNGQAGGPAYALHLVDGSSVNADFETANRFPNQQRVVLRAA